MDFVTANGHEAVQFQFDGQLPSGLDIVFFSGPFGSVAPFGKQLLLLAQAERPALIWWLTEQLPNPAWPKPLVRAAGALRSHVDRYAFREQVDGTWQAVGPARRLTHIGHRYRYYGDLYWLRKSGVLTVVVTGSPWRADYLRDRGFDPYVPPTPSFRPNWGADLKLVRDIPVLWLGKVATKRRERRLSRIRRDLRERGVELLVIDGVENPYIFGEDRTILLNRTKIVLNLLRTRWDNTAGRYALAAQNKCLLVTEPTLSHVAFEPGVHIVRASVDEMADTICHYLTHETERLAIAERAYSLIQQNPREAIIGDLLEHVAALR
jgi:hypothetical protein